MNTPNPNTAPGRPPAVWPTLQAHDAPALIDFLVDVVGFRRTAVHGDGDRVDHAQLDWPEGGGIMLGSHRPEGRWHREPGTFGCYVVTAHVDALYEKVRRAGARILTELTDQDFGSRDFIMADPEGNHWCFGTYPGEPAPR